MKINLFILDINFKKQLIKEIKKDNIEVEYSKYILFKDEELGIIMLNNKEEDFSYTYNGGCEHIFVSIFSQNKSSDELKKLTISKLDEILDVGLKDYFEHIKSQIINNYKYGMVCY